MADHAPELGPRISWVRRFARRWPIVLFFLFTYSYSWTAWFYIQWFQTEYHLLEVPTPEASSLPILPFIVYAISRLTATFGPAIAALVVTGIIDGKQGIRTLLSKVIRFKTHIWFWIAVIVIPVIIQFVSPVGIGLALTDSQLIVTTSGFLAILSVFVQNLLWSGGQEEIGFRGFAQDRLQNKFGLIKVSLMIGTLWFFWHLPLYLWISNTAQYGDSLFFGLLNQLAVCFIFTWVYYQTGSVLLAMVLHALFNTMPTLVDIDLQSNQIALYAWIVRIGITSAIGLALFKVFPKKISGI